MDEPPENAGGLLLLELPDEYDLPVGEDFGGEEEEDAGGAAFDPDEYDFPVGDVYDGFELELEPEEYDLPEGALYDGFELEPDE